MQSQSVKPILIQRLEWVWKSLFVVVTVSTAALFKKFHEDMQELSQKYILRANLYHLLWILPLMLVMKLYHNGIPAIAESWVLKLIDQKRYANPERRMKRVRLMSKWCADVPYYFLTTFIAFMIMKNQKQFPSFLGGTNSYPDKLLGCFMCKGIQKLDVEQQNVLVMQVFYILQISHHLYGLLKHLFGVTHYGLSKYYEYLFHHLAAVVLLLLSYFINYWKIGIMVLMFHDFSDAVLQTGRFLLDTIYRTKFRMVIGYPIIFIVWILGRLVLFPSCCIYTVILSGNYHMLTSKVLLALQSSLFFMHIYWTYQIIVSAFITQKDY